MNFRHMKLIRAEDGERGGIKVMHGRDGKDTILDVPIGTIVTDTEDGTVLADLSQSGEQFVLCE